MSWTGHVDAVGPTALVVDLPATGFDWHTHPRHQLALAGRGVVVVAVGERAWVLPPPRGLWVPAGVNHAVSAPGAATLSSIYVDPERCPLVLSEPLVVAVDGLLRELVGHLGRADLAPEARARAEALVWDVVRPVPATTVVAPLPTDDRARCVAEALRADPTDGRSLEAWGRAVGASSRTLARVFVAQTGMGFGRWRTHTRLAAALPLLAAGEGVGAVARQVGFATPSAFVAAFRRELGTTPARHFT